MMRGEKTRFEQLLRSKEAQKNSAFGCMRGSVRILGDVVGPSWDEGPWDAELGIAYHGENGPVYYTGNGTETTDDLT